MLSQSNQQRKWWGRTVKTPWRLTLIFILLQPMALARRLNERPLSPHRRGQHQQHREVLDISANEEDLIPVIIGFKEAEYRGLGIIVRLSHLIRPRFRRVNAVSAVVTPSELERLYNDPDIAYIEPDGLVTPDNYDRSTRRTSEAMLYGLSMVQAESSLIPASPATSYNAQSSTTTEETTTTTTRARTSACNDPNSFKIGIVDSGLAINHPDIPCLPRSLNNTNCIGREFGLDDGDGVWYNPMKKYHGTHVAGTIGATGLNRQGIQGVLNDGNFCFVIGRVFGESGAGSRMSAVFEAVEWMLDQGVKVINLSLGSPLYSSTGDKLMSAAYTTDGVLMVAASGNEGSDEIHFPANYQNVLSVAAVDETRAHATFSQYNEGVDLTGPGVDILSTFPLTLGGAVIVSTSTVSAVGSLLAHSSEPSTSVAVNGLLIECPEYGVNVCPGGGGHVCLIERGGGVLFEQKTLHCEQGGGIAAVIYNNLPGYMGGGLPNTTATTIPAIQVNARDGRAIKDSGAVGQSMSIEVTKGYGYLSGTSMAVPHVTGVIAKIWRACPQCTNVQVESCLISTAIDLGEEGRDILYGNGLVQAEASYLCLLATEQCCDNNMAESSSATTTSVAPTQATPAPIPSPPPVQWMGSGDNWVAMSISVGE